ncbi:MAG: PAS domain S-box protein [Spirochaetota bacterium]
MAEFEINKDKGLPSSLDLLRERNEQLKHLLEDKIAMLLQTESNYKALFNSISDAVIIYDLEGFILDINDNGLGFLAISKEDIIGKSIITYFSSEFTENLISVIEDRAAFERKIFETSVIINSTAFVPVRVNSRLVEYNNEFAILSIFRDMRERKATEELRKLHETFVESSDEAIIGITLDTKIVSWNSSAERISGYASGEVMGRSFSMVASPFQSDEFTRLMDRVKNGEKIQLYETTGVTKSGNLVNLVVSILPVINSAGNIIGASITARDITDEIKAKETIKKGKSFLKNLEEINPAFYIAMDSQGKILNMNRAMLIATGHSLASVVGKDYIELLFDESDRELQRRDFMNTLKKKKSAQREYSIRGIDGEEIIVEWHGKPLLNVEGEVEFFFYVGIDITERRLLEKSIMEANTAERFKMGQELHSRVVQHLAGITFRGELLKLKISDTSVEALADIDEIMGLVVQAMNKARDLAKELSPVDDNHDGLKSAVESLKEDVKIKHNVDIHLKWDVTAVIKGKLEISSLYYLISDSVSNSIENNKAKNIILSLHRESNICVLEIRDDGLDYDQIDRDKNKAFLKLIKYRSWLIGASVEVSSNPGGGIFILCRFKTGVEAEEKPDLHYNLFHGEEKHGRKKSSVLIIDSHPVVRQGLSQIIDRERDIQICGEASTAEGALNFLGRVVPDLMTVDIALTGSGGLDLIKACRERYPSLPILVISVYEESIYAERAIRAGARGYVMKNEPPFIILTAIRTVLEGRQYMSDSLKEKLLNKLYLPGQNEEEALVDALTDREYEVFQLIGRGYGNKHIAEKLRVSVKTVENYREKLKNKLSMESSSDLIQFAVQWLIDRTS